MITRLTVSALVIATLQSPVLAINECQDYRRESYPHQIAARRTASPSKTLARDGNLVLLGLTTSGVTVFDVSNPYDPVDLGTFATAGEPVDIVIVGNLAFVAEGTTGLEIFDLGRRFGAGPLRPTLVGTYSNDVHVDAVAADQNYAYLACWFDGVHILDVSDPTTPNLVATDLSHGSRDVALQDNVLFSVRIDEALLSLDVSDPLNPEPIGSAGVSGWEAGVHVQGNRAYVSVDLSGGGQGLWFIDVSDPTELSPVGYFGFASSYVYSVNRVEDHLFVGASSGLTILDVSTESSATRIHRIDLGTRGASVEDDFAFIASGSRGFIVADVSNPAEPAPLSWFGGDIYRDAKFLEDTLYTCSVGYAFDSGLSIYDVSDLETPKRVGFVSTGSHPYGIDVTGEHAYVGFAHGELRVYDASQPDTLVALSGLSLDGETYRVRVQGSVAHLAAGDEGYQIVDVSDPLQPVLLGALPSTGSVYDLAVRGQTVFLADSETGLSIVNAADPGAPVVIASNFTGTGAYGVFLQDDLAYVGGDQFRVVNIQDPSNPVVIGSLGLGTSSVTVIDEFAYSARGNGYRVVDVSNATSPRSVGAFDLREASYGIGTYLNTFVVFGGAGHHGGLYTGFVSFYPSQCPSTDSPFVASVPATDRDELTLSTPRPNPFREQTTVELALTTPGQVNLTVHDLQGRVVRTLIARSLATGRHVVPWDGRDEAGTLVSSGVYFIRADAEGLVSKRKLVRLR